MAVGVLLGQNKGVQSVEGIQPDIIGNVSLQSFLDATLLKSDKAASAKATGEALDTKLTSGEDLIGNNVRSLAYLKETSADGFTLLKEIYPTLRINTLYMVHCGAGGQVRGYIILKGTEEFGYALQLSYIEGFAKYRLFGGVWKEEK